MIKKIALVLMFTSLFSRGEKINLSSDDKQVFFGVSFGKKDMLGPYVGVWPLFYMTPQRSQGMHLEYSKNENSRLVNLTMCLNDGGSAVYYKIDLDDFTMSGTSKEKREEIIKGKHLLDWDKYPQERTYPEMNNDIFISKYVLGYRNTEEVLLWVVFGKNQETIRKYVQLPLYMAWGTKTEGWKEPFDVIKK